MLNLEGVLAKATALPDLVSVPHEILESLRLLSEDSVNVSKQHHSLNGTYAPCEQACCCHLITYAVQVLPHASQHMLGVPARISLANSALL